MAALLTVLAACHESGGSSDPHGGPSPGLLTNHGISALSVKGQGELWIARVEERGEGGLDRNGDGDAQDVVLAVLDLTDGSLTNVALAHSITSYLTVGDHLIAFDVLESEQGQTDLNGDGDTTDRVLHVYDARTRTTTSTALAVGAPAPVITADAVAFTVSEHAQGGTDLDGSGRVDGFVLHIFDARTGIVANAMRNVTSGFVHHGDAIAFSTDERSARSDLNADGDVGDTRIFQVYDLVLGRVISVPLALGGLPIGVLTRHWLVPTDEAGQAADLNGDSDQDDVVLLAVEPDLGRILDAGVTLFPASALSNGTHVALVASERDGNDRNHDGDLDDLYAASIRPSRGQVFVADVPLHYNDYALLVLTPEHVGFLTSDHRGLTLVRMNIFSGEVESNGLDALAVDAAGRRIVCTRHETTPMTQEDRNGDGDFDDIVHSYISTQYGDVAHSQLATVGAIRTSANALLILSSELAQAMDLNGDGDRDDCGWVHHDLESRVNTPLAAAPMGPDQTGLRDDHSGVLLVSEADTGPFAGTDLNGDGDTADSVLHAFRVP